MRKFVGLLMLSTLLYGCAAAVASMYGVRKHVDQFADNQLTVVMTGGVIDADYLGIVTDAGQFNPYVIRSNGGKVIETGILFEFENNTILSGDRWLNIRKGSTAIFLLNNGAERVELKALSGEFDVSVHDRGVFVATPAQLRTIAYATSVEVRVSGASSSIDFPRKPNNHVVDNFLPNLRKFYDTEVAPFLN